MNVVLFLHIAAAIFLIGPATAAMMASPRAIRAGDAGLAVLRSLYRATRVFGAASVLVLGLGAAVVPLDRHASWGSFWISASITLFVVALGLLFLLVVRDQRGAIRGLESTGEPVLAAAHRIRGTGGAISVIWLAVVALMVFRP